MGHLLWCLVLLLLLLLVTIHTSNGQPPTCAGGAPCVLNCVGNSVCNSAILNCADTHPCTVNCEGRQACKLATVNCPSAAACIVNCGMASNGKQSCEFMTLNAQSSTELTGNAGAEAALKDAAINCPQTGSEKCQLKANDAANVFRRTKLYTVDGFADVDITCTLPTAPTDCSVSSDVTTAEVHCGTGDPLPNSCSVNALGTACDSILTGVGCDGAVATPAPTGVTAAPTPSPTDVTPGPTGVTPAPTDVTPAPTAVTPAPVPQPTPSPTDVTPAPTEVTAAPTDVTPAPTDVTPAPTPQPSLPTLAPTPSAFPGSCLAEPPELAWTFAQDNSQLPLIGNYSATLTMAVGTFVVTYPNALTKTVTTRLWNGIIPGPTLRMQRGRVYRVTVVNALGPESPNNPTADNVFKDANTTNLHIHGPHISGQRSGDSPFIVVKNGESHTYDYHLPCDHAGALFWYHPHHHGSTTLQSGGGATGLLVIEDDKVFEGLPDWYTDMRVFLLHIQEIDINAINNRYPTNIDDIFNAVPAGGGQTPDQFFLLNGEHTPDVCINSHEWTRLRISLTSPFSTSIFFIDTEGSTTCQLRLLARDGVLVRGDSEPEVPSVPRTIGNGVFLTESSRADIAVWCPGNAAGDARYDIIQNNRYSINPNNQEATQVVGVIAVLGTETSVPTAPALTPFKPIRPPYQKNTLAATETVDKNFAIRITGSAIGSPPVSYSHTTDPVTGFVIPAVGYTMVSGEIAEFTRTGQTSHPLHIHINHMQVVSTVANTPAIPFGFQEPGDFVDTFVHNGVFRYFADTFGGKAAAHCHILPHSDAGALTTLEIQGGCGFDIKRSLDPTGVVCGAAPSACQTLAPTPAPP